MITDIRGWNRLEIYTTRKRSEKAEDTRNSFANDGHNYNRK
jgi:hypothetical protein